MEIKLKKQIETLEREITLKSVDLDEDIEDFNVDIHDFNDQEKLITISPRCVRCNLCVEECPINVISSSTWLKKAKIGEECVQFVLKPVRFHVFMYGMLNQSLRKMIL